MATRNKEATIPETEEQKKPAEQAAEQEQDTKLAQEVEELKAQYTDLKALLQQAISAMAKTAEAKPAAPAQDKTEVLDMTGATMAEDEGTEWEEYETVRTIRASKGQEKSIVVSVNDRNVQIPLDGKAYRLRKPHAEIFLQSMDANVAAEEFAENVPNEAAPQSYADLVKQISELKVALKGFGVNV